MGGAFRREPTDSRVRRFETAHCPTCAHVVDSAKQTPGRLGEVPTDPRDGDFVLCFYCLTPAMWVITDNVVGIRLLSPAEHMIFDETWGHVVRAAARRNGRG